MPACDQHTSRGGRGPGPSAVAVMDASGRGVCGAAAFSEDVPHMASVSHAAFVVVQMQLSGCVAEIRVDGCWSLERTLFPV